MVVKIQIELIDEDDVETLFELIDLVFVSAQVTGYPKGDDR